MRLKSIAILSATAVLGAALGWAAAASYQKTGTVKEVAADKAPAKKK